ncbi:MAG: hypothetical protein HMLKMBBP_02497 [Planctomycetes bacterium]|nr:hypothetical protein [Planctomycetota bacterium]
MAIGKTSVLFSLVAIGLLAGGAAEADAKGRGRGNRGDRVELTRPQHAADANAAGSVEVGRNGSTLTVKNLAPRTTYDVVDAATGERVGALRTNRKGKGTFKVGGGNRKSRAAENGGSEDGMLPDEVEIVDPATGECVLEGDLGDINPDDFRYLTGWMMDGDPETGTVMCSMTSSSDPWMGDVEDFSFTYCPPYGEGQEFDTDVPHTFYAGTYAEDGLPFGVKTVADLSGRTFEVRDLDGNVLKTGTLPELEEMDVWVPEDPGIWEGEPGQGGEWDNWEDWETGEDWNWDDEEFFIEPWLDGGPTGGGWMADGTRNPGRGGVRNFVEEEPELVDNGFRLWIENDEGEMTEIAPLLTWNWDDVIWIDDPIMGDPGDMWDGGWDGEWDAGWNGWLDQGMVPGEMNTTTRGGRRNRR